MFVQNFSLKSHATKCKKRIESIIRILHGRHRKKANAKIVSIVNQKGGVGKTTTAVNLATILAIMDKKVLLIDLDSQGNSSSGLGIMQDQRKITSYHLFQLLFSYNFHYLGGINIFDEEM